jgi:hypothetical protein
MFSQNHIMENLTPTRTIIKETEHKMTDATEITDKTSLIRKCENCGSITAVDLDNTPENKADLEYEGQII